MYKLLDDGKFIIENYRESSPFSSFLPGIAGTDGIPMWAFYVNRGQGMASFGVENKDNAISEFLPSDKMYQLISTNGFRTFIKGKIGEETFKYEAFATDSDKITEKMIIEENLLTIKLEDEAKHLDIEICYYTLPRQSLAGLIREVTITNTGTETLELELADGLSSMFPADVSNGAYKEIGNTLKSWFDVVQLEESLNYYFLRGSTSDDAEVSQSDKGNFYTSIVEKAGVTSIPNLIFDRQLIFGHDLSLGKAVAFNQNSIDSSEPQISTNKISGSFSVFKENLHSGESVKLYSVFGQSNNREEALAFKNNQLSAENFINFKEQARELTNELTSRVETKTALPEFDAYVKQNFLDNGLRGGFPFIFENGEDFQPFYLYARKHGDLERDYNFFSISPEYYSQGNGNYRDMNQNRRIDVLMEPKIGDRMIKQFMNLIQLDGYNPLALKAVKFTLKNHEFNFKDFGFSDEQAIELKKMSIQGFTPGKVREFVLNNKVELNQSFEAFLTKLLSASDEVLEAEFGEGYWSDHWTYNLDLIDYYLKVFPDKLSECYFSDGYLFFDAPASVRPRNETYHRLEDGTLRQYRAIKEDEDKIHQQAKGEKLWLEFEGKRFTTNLYSKLILLAATKTANIAPFGFGIEMEAGKPGWNDSLNGLPGMLGSGTSELYELKRLFTTLKEVTDLDVEGKVVLPKESLEFLSELTEKLRDCVDLSLDDWNDRANLRETYREQIENSLSGEISTVSFKKIAENLEVLSDFVDKAVTAVEQFDSELVPTYFTFDAKISEENDITEITPIAVAPFLEGIVKKMKTSGDQKDAKELYEKVKNSDIYDKKLGMYKTSQSISDEPIELGRAKFFTPGWLENESIFLHMTYKYLLELIKNDLLDEFFTEMKKGILPFTDPNRYGRNTLENSSFLASSANPDPSIHGKGFVARLSGSTVEFLTMWSELMFGNQPFSYKDGELSFHLNPKLSSEFFPETGDIAVKLFGETEVIYHNLSRKATYGQDAVHAQRYTITDLDNQKVVVNQSTIVGSLAEKIRNKEVKTIEVELD